MTAVIYLALVEYDPVASAWGVVVPDLPGCTAMGLTEGEALANGIEAMREWAVDVASEISALPRARTEVELRADLSLADDFTAGTKVIRLAIEGEVDHVG